MYFGASGWREGLPIGTKDCIDTGNSCSGEQRWTWTKYQQDVHGDTYSSYRDNPRVIESGVGDGSHTKKITTEYLLPSPAEGESTTIFGLVKETKIYDPTNLKRRVVNEYNLGINYAARRIIGLLSKTEVYGSSGTNLVSKMTYLYDEGTYTSVTPTQHDTTNYGTGFIYRGNRTTAKRWDINNPTSSSINVSRTGYNTAGSPISVKDALDRETVISYADNWNDTSRTTYAYPTTITEPGPYSSTIKYRFDIGANVWAQSPPPAGHTYGKTTSRVYKDTTGQIEKEALESNGGAYTRYSYPGSGNVINSFSTIIDMDNSGTATSADEVETDTYFDGAGRVIASRSPHTFSGNSTSTWAGVVRQYDLLGRPVAQSVPTEMTESWIATGDDSSRGWVSNRTEYDWKGRVLRQIPPDSNGTNDYKWTDYTYLGCGCAGGQTTTIQGPKTDAVPVAGTTPEANKRRVQKIQEDPLGRTQYVELWDLDGAGTAPYSTTENVFNDRDQITDVIEYVGAASIGNTNRQTTSMIYDGHGRVSTIHKPEFYNGTISSPTYITRTYNNDDSVATITDPRGAVTTFTYGLPSSSEKRALVTGISFSAPAPPSSPSPTPTPIAVPSPVTFVYDPAGNRTSMADDTGTVTYAYDQLSRLTSETKDFVENLSQSTYALAYTYQLGGGLRSITDPFGNEVNYTGDRAGKVTSISDGAGPSAYYSEIRHRAFGGLRSLSVNLSKVTTTVSIEYDNALRPVSYQATLNSGFIQKANYTYNHDGLTKEVGNEINSAFNNKNEYDFAARLKMNDVGLSGQPIHPLKQILDYDQYSNLTGRTNWLYTFDSRYFTTTYENNRKIAGSGGSTNIYDSAGNLVSANTTTGYSDTTQWRFDAGGRSWWWEEVGPFGTGMHKGEKMTFDGDGRAAKRVAMDKDTTQNVNAPWNEVNGYHIFSTVTGQKISDLDYNGDLIKTYVYMGSLVIAEKRPSLVDFKFTDPITGSKRTTDSDGVVFTNDEDIIEVAALNTLVPPTNVFPEPRYDDGAFPGNPENGCEFNGLPVLCDMVGDFAPWTDPIGNPIPDPILQDFPDDLVFADGARKSYAPDGEKQNCYTFYELIFEHPGVQDFFNSLWDKTVAAAKERYENRNNPGSTDRRETEFGGLLTLNAKENSVHPWDLGPALPDPALNGLYDFYENRKEALRQAVAAGEGRLILVNIHTHVPDGPFQKAGPYVGEEQRRTLLTWDPNVVTAGEYRQGPSAYDWPSGDGIVDIVIWGRGKGKFSVYGEADDPKKLKQMCVPFVASLPRSPAR